MRASPTTSEILAAYVVRQQDEPLDEAVAQAARRSLVDWHAAAIAGCGHSPLPELIEAFADELGHGASRLIAGSAAPPRVAAFFDGTASHVAEVDDVFREAVFHPGSPTIAAARAVALAAGASRSALLRAVVAGYEVSTRLAQAVFPAHHAYWHPTGTIGCIGAAAAASALLRLGERRTTDALSNAVTLAAGLRRGFASDSMTKPLHAGHAAEVGVLAAKAAEAGVTGAADIFDGPNGFGAAMSDAPDFAAAFADLGSMFNIVRITVKNHCCCGQAFAAIDAALGVRGGCPIESADVASVRISTYAQAIEVAGHRPVQGATDARFCIPFLVAHALRHGSVRINASGHTARTDMATRALMDRIELVADPSYDARYPGKRCARVEIVLKSGERLSHEVKTRKGDPDAPLSDRELDAKFIELVSPALGADAARDLLQDLWNPTAQSLAAIPPFQISRTSG